MKRLIDLREQIGDGTRFAFFDTVKDEFEVFSGFQTWEYWEEFERDYDGDELERYRRLAPAWLRKN